MALSNNELREWRNSRSTAKRIAGSLAVMIQDGSLSRYHDLPGNGELAEEWRVSTRTVGRAKLLLAQKRLIKKAGNAYFIAPDYTEGID
jgi:DNA-binding GntR family transcriptional regulator